VADRDQHQDERLIGTAGGFGKGKALPLDEVIALFESCQAEPAMRSVTAILRVAREQLEARGALRVNGWLGWTFIVLAISEAVAFALKIPVLKDYWPYGLASALVGLILVIGMISVRSTAAAAEAQKAVIAERAILSLTVLAENPDWKRKPLDWSNRLTLERLVKSTKTGQSLLDEFPA
jgi:hypothetical protein